MKTDLSLDDLQDLAPVAATRIDVTKQALPVAFPWYPYSTFGNAIHLRALAQGSLPSIGEMATGRPILDIGCADGDFAFFLEGEGFDVQVVDWPPTNFNGMQGVQALRDALGSRVEIHAVDLDSQFALPSTSYGLTFAMGLLYHLKNPFFFLEQLAHASEWCVLSTRVFQNPRGDATDLSSLSLAYLVDPLETNNDPTIFWIFTTTGLERLVTRAGWDLVRGISVGCLTGSDPSSPDRDERFFCLLRSRVVA